MNTNSNLKTVVPSQLTESSSNDSSEKKTTVLSKFRIVQLALYILSDLANSITIFSFQTIAAQISKIYDLDPFLVSLNISVYSLMYPFISVIANFTIDTCGASVSVKIGLILTSIGSIMRIFVNETWDIVIISSVFCGAGGPMIFNSKCRFQSNWFNANDLALITTISTILTTCNSVFGTLFPGIYFTGYDYKDDKSLPQYSDGKSLLENMLKIQAIMVGVLTLISLIFLREKPFIPPSYTSTLVREKFQDAVKVMLKNKSYVKLNVASMIYVGSVSSLSALFSFAIEPWGFNQTHYTMCAAGMILGGIIGAVINAQLLKKYKKFKQTVIFLLFWLAFVLFVIGFVINTYEISVLIVFVTLFGFGYYPLASTTYELACEVAFPVGEGSAQGFLMGNNSIFAFICITLFSLFVKGQNKLSTYMLLLAIFLSLLISIIIIYKADISLNRLNKEFEMEQNQIIIDKKKLEERQRIVQQRIRQSGQFQDQQLEQQQLEENQLKSSRKNSERQNQNEYEQQCEQ